MASSSKRETLGSQFFVVEATPGELPPPHHPVPEFPRDERSKSQFLGHQQKMHELFGKVTLAILGLPRYQHLTLADLTSIVLEPLLRNRIAVAYGHQTSMPQELDTAGFAFWASVSPDVDAKLNAQANAGEFPVRLKPEDWTSGPIHWLLDIVAPSPQIASQMLVNFQQVAKGNMVKFHPVVSTLVDKAMLGSMIFAAAPGANPLATSN
jgi:cytolysin-activating lysine-acyltransferase